MTLFRAEGIRKTYGATVALDRIDFTVHGGAVNVLIGENGAGKSTLMRIIAGVEQPDEGRLLVDDVEVRFAYVGDAACQGVGIVFQELNLCSNLSVTENIFLSRNIMNRICIDHDAERQRTKSLLDRLGADIDPDAQVDTLRIGERQIVEIARALAEDVRILILDEPTSALSAREVEILFCIIGELRQAGVGVIYISHRLEELVRIGDYVTILRDGRLVADAKIADVSVPWIVEQMLGETGATQRPPRGTKAGNVVLSVSDMQCVGPNEFPLVNRFSAEFRAGEITAIFGLLGAGRSELFGLICGSRRGTGDVRLNDENLMGLSLPERVERRLLLVPEDRQGEGLFQNLDVSANLSLSSLRRLAQSGVILRQEEQDAVLAMIAQLGVKVASASAGIASLSGGNQQKVVIGRCLMSRPAAILLDEPSRGIDVGARAEIYGIMNKLAAEGVAVIFATSDVTEAMMEADRILIMARGELVADLDARDADEKTLIGAANKVLVTSE